ncbi:MAG: hypothetical protein ABIH01_02600 [Candidatus Omnitrophota bacterium]
MALIIMQFVSYGKFLTQIDANLTQIHADILSAIIRVPVLSADRQSAATCVISLDAPYFF